MIPVNERNWRSTRGVIATEVAFLMPVVLVGVMMLFELARIALVIAVGSAALDKAVQTFRLDDLQSDSAEQMGGNLKERMISSAYGYLQEEDLTVSVLHFDNLSQLGGLTINSDSEDSGTLPVWSVTVQITKAFITPLPEVLTLGDTFRYQYKHVFGTELRND
ncbi:MULTISPECIES: TadE/TadG family type IV pilus assembly protein [unclassified Brenneria]|nr:MULTISPECIES: hypothetical protein [unclassified Brenneria]MBJ7222686.1 hypothetical protein [Brenneria sp. L3-3C-1]MEE3643929.1 hypothetical protein [Brenneria sp. L3_3C_1]MEE3651118.1 hypothetical protein [Brenneria sp. HEZEL_4_2_4]NPD01073.1 hypothetical protein [Brenneria sp. hezel4-2-4]